LVYIQHDQDYDRVLDIFVRASAGVRPKKSADAGSSVENLTHKDTRVNILTEELCDFMADDEKALKAILYAGDPSLDPQLIWKGKDQQDRHPLDVSAVPHLHPGEDLPARDR
jgi:hypothetical protein